MNITHTEVRVFTSSLQDLQQPDSWALELIFVGKNVLFYFFKSIL